MVSKPTILGCGNLNSTRTSHQEMMKMLDELKELVMQNTSIVNSISNQHVLSNEHRPPPAPPHHSPELPSFYTSELFPTNLSQINTTEFSAPHMFDESSLRHTSLHTFATPTCFYDQSRFDYHCQIPLPNYNQQPWSMSHNLNHAPLYSVDHYYYSQPQTLLTHAPQHPYTLTVQTTLSTGQPYYTTEPTTVFENVHSIGDLRPVGKSMDVCEIDDKQEVVSVSAVKNDVEKMDQLEACEDVLESETKDEVSVEKENMSTCEAVSDIYEIDYGTVTAEEVGCVDEAKDEVETNAKKLLPPLLHLAFQAFDKFISKVGRFPIATKLQKKLEDAQVFIVGSGASRDPSKKQAPMCTVHSSPHNIDHWLIWARSEFEGLLEKTPTEVDTILSDTSEYTSAIVNAGIFERKDKDAMFSFVEATSKQQDRVRTLFDTGWNTSHQKHIHNDKFEGVVITYRQVGELFNPPAALKSVFSAAKIERLGNWFNDGSDPRWCCTCLLDATDPLFIEIGKAFIRKIFDPGGQALEVTRRWRDDFWSVMSVAYLICLGAVFGVLRLNRFRKKNKLNMDRYISKILENHEGLTEDYWPLYVVAGAVATVLGWVVVVTWFMSKPDDEVFSSYFDYILEDKNVLKRRHM